MKPKPRWIVIALFGLTTVVAFSVAFAATLAITSERISVFSPNQPPPPCTPETNTFSADRDSYVEVGSGTNFGGATTLRVESGGGLGGTRSRTLVRFALPTIPEDCSITTATLRLYNQDPESGRTIDAYRITADWQEGTVDGDAIPATATPAAASVTVSAAGYQTWNVTTQLQAIYGASNFGFLMRDRTESTSLLGSSRAQVYQSREGTDNTRDPELIISWDD